MPETYLRKENRENISQSQSRMANYTIRTRVQAARHGQDFSVVDPISRTHTHRLTMKSTNAGLIESMLVEKRRRQRPYRQKNELLLLVVFLFAGFRCHGLLHSCFMSCKKDYCNTLTLFIAVWLNGRMEEWLAVWLTGLLFAQCSYNIFF